MGKSLFVPSATHGVLCVDDVSENLVIATLEWFDRDCEPHKHVFPGYEYVCAAVLGKARGVGSHEDRRVESVGRPLVHDSSCHGGRVKAAGALLAKVGTTRLSCGVGGRDE
ncbi:hypothetical protein CRG98_042110 [Punica granatum]|uniref:Uncharacterized protein n=1 Tax=Punica granatum TaxID=22663 RepID=A0A2I0I1Z6_PUNGR|nr:hypothetical protein CRG98_042110 [Punica granatum]